MKALIKLSLVIVLIAFAVASTGFLIPSLSQTTVSPLDNAQWDNIEINFNETISDLTEAKFIFYIKQNYSSTGIKINLEDIINQTNFPITDLKNMKFFTRENITFNESIHSLNCSEVNATTGNGTIVTTKTCSANYITKESWRWDWEEAKDFTFQNNIPSQTSKSFAKVITIPKIADQDEFSNNGTKWFQLTVRTPITNYLGGWGSTLAFTVKLSDADDGIEKHPFQNTSFDKRIPVSQNRYQTNESIEFFLNNASGFLIADVNTASGCKDIVVTNGTDGTSATVRNFQIPVCNSTHVSVIYLFNETGLDTATNSSSYVYYKNNTPVSSRNITMRYLKDDFVSNSTGNYTIGGGGYSWVANCGTKTGCIKVDVAGPISGISSRGTTNFAQTMSGNQPTENIIGWNELRSDIVSGGVGAGIGYGLNKVLPSTFVQPKFEYTSPVKSTSLNSLSSSLYSTMKVTTTQTVNKFNTLVQELSINIVEKVGGTLTNSYNKPLNNYFDGHFYNDGSFWSPITNILSSIGGLFGGVKLVENNKKNTGFKNSTFKRFMRYLIYGSLTLTIGGSILSFLTELREVFIVVSLGFLGFAIFFVVFIVRTMRTYYLSFKNKLTIIRTVKKKDTVKYYYLVFSEIIKIIGYVYITLFIIGMPFALLFNFPFIVFTSILIAIGLIVVVSISFIYFLIRKPELVILEIKQNMWIIIATIIFSLLTSLSKISDKITIFDYIVFAVITVGIFWGVSWVLAKLMRSK